MPCDDKAGYASIVGMYEPNAFGLHDTLGNSGEYVADCYHEDYAGAANDGSTRPNAKCQQRIVRGGAWHWRGSHFSERVSVAADNVHATSGFRVAEDVDGTVPAPATHAPSAFALELAEAQRIERERRSKIPELPRT